MNVEPKRGMRFEHARRITGSPKAGTAQAEVCEVTQTNQYTVYFKAVVDGRPVGVSWRKDRDRFHEIVLRVL